MICRRTSTSTETRTGSPVTITATRARAIEPRPSSLETRQYSIDSGRGPHQTALAARQVVSNFAKDKVFKTVFAALEKQTITVRDLDELLHAFVDDPAIAGVPDDVIILDSGYWVRRDDIVNEGTCRCERNTCVGRGDKVYSYFEASLSPWVINTGLFWRCYDEIISCPRCSGQHKRGHIGREDVCGRPYLDQKTQRD